MINNLAAEKLGKYFMKKIYSAISLLVLLSIFSGCSAPYSELKSPCAGAAGSPCERRPVNDKWLQEKNNS